LNDSVSMYATSSYYQNPLAQRSSAEWIVEAPTEPGGSYAALPQFSPVTFTNASAVINGVLGPINSSHWQYMAENIGSGPILQDITSVLVNSGTGFVVSYNPSNATIPLAATASQSRAPSNATFEGTTTESTSHAALPVSHRGRAGHLQAARVRMPIRQLRRVADGSVKEVRSAAVNG
jgi:hypothetical protein